MNFGRHHLLKKRSTYRSKGAWALCSCSAPSMDAELTHGLVLNQIGPGFSEANARAIVEPRPEASIFGILSLAKQVAELSGLLSKVDSSVPSGQMATFLKPSSKGRRKKPGAQPGHAGSRRKVPYPLKPGGTDSSGAPTNPTAL